ncbi:MAG: hypothetical protein M3327_08505 [Actinomycetota bacterium]|nr:hypothetical protein [Actinomycetota bacterium]
MSGSRLLVVTTVHAEEGALRDYMRQRVGGDWTEIKIVAPAAKLSPLQWLASDEDAARSDAGAAAAEGARAVAGDAAVETEVGDPDPVQAIEDGLRTFPADEVLVITPPGEEANWLEQDAGAEARERFGVPVTHLTYEAG